MLESGETGQTRKHSAALAFAELLHQLLHRLRSQAGDILLRLLTNLFQQMIDEMRRARQELDAFAPDFRVRQADGAWEPDSVNLKVDQKLSSLEPQNPLAFYNLACSYSLNEEFDLAVAALDKAISLGFRDFKWLTKDPDLRDLRKHPLYRVIAAKIRKMKIKVSS